MISAKIPEHQQTLPWVRSLVGLIQEQPKTIQSQAEQIAQLKTTVQELRDEITRLKKTPKHPKFRPSEKPSSGRLDKQKKAKHSASSVQELTVIPKDSV